MVSDDPEEEKKQKAFNGLLNKLTPDNFERILEKMFAIGIIAPKTLRGLIDRVRTCRPPRIECPLWSLPLLPQLTLSTVSR